MQVSSRTSSVRAEGKTVYVKLCKIWLKLFTFHEFLEVSIKLVSTHLISPNRQNGTNGRHGEKREKTKQHDAEADQETEKEVDHLQEENVPGHQNEEDGFRLYDAI